MVPSGSRKGVSPVLRPISQYKVRKHPLSSALIWTLFLEGLLAPCFDFLHFIHNLTIVLSIINERLITEKKKANFQVHNRFLCPRVLATPYIF